MKNFLKNIFLFVFLVILSSCGTEEVVKQTAGKIENPIDIVNTTQKNVISNLNKKSLLRRNVKANIKGNVFINSKSFQQDGEIFVYFKRYDNYLTGNIKLKTKLKGILKADIKANMDFLSVYTGEFYKINNFKIITKNKQLGVFNRYFSSILGTWIYKKNETINIYDILDGVNKYDLINVHTELGKYRYNVSLKKDNLVKMMYDVYSKNSLLGKKDLNFFKKKYKNYDIKGILKIEDNKKYFSFDGIINNFGKEIPIKLNYLDKKFYLNIDNGKLLLDLKKKNNDFAGILNLKSDKYGDLKFNVTGKMTDKLFKLDLEKKDSKNIFKIFINSEFKKVNKFTIQSPKNFIKFDSVKEYFR